MRVNELMVNAGRDISTETYRLVRSLLIFQKPAIHAGHYWACELEENDIIDALKFHNIYSAYRYIDLLSEDRLMRAVSGRMFGGIIPSDKLVIADGGTFYYYIGSNNQLELFTSYLGVSLDPCTLKVRYKPSGRYDIELFLFSDGEIRLKVSQMFAPRDLARVIAPMALMVGLPYSRMEELIVENGNIVCNVQFDMKSVLESEEYKQYSFYGRTFRFGHLLAGVSSDSGEDTECDSE